MAIKKYLLTVLWCSLIVIMLNAANKSVDSGNAFMFYKNIFWSNLTKKNWTFDFLLSNLWCVSFIAKYSLVFTVPKSIHKWSNSFSTHKRFFRILLCQLLVISGVFKKMTCVSFLWKMWNITLTLSTFSKLFFSHVVTLASP